MLASELPRKQHISFDPAGRHRARRKATLRKIPCSLYQRAVPSYHVPDGTLVDTDKAGNDCARRAVPARGFSPAVDAGVIQLYNLAAQQRETVRVLWKTPGIFSIQDKARPPAGEPPDGSKALFPPYSPGPHR